MEFYTYVLYSEKYNRIYVGQTNNLQKRLNRHNSGNVKSTKSYLPWRIIYSEKIKNRSEALVREKKLKTHKGRDYIRKEILRNEL